MADDIPERLAKLEEEVAALKQPRLYGPVPSVHFVNELDKRRQGD